MGTWERWLTAMLALALVAVMWPAARAAMERSRQVEKPDWMSALVPLVLVVLFVVLLVFLA